MRRVVLLMMILMCPLFSGCSKQKATGTQQRWTEIRTATDNLIESLYLSQMAQSEKYTKPGAVQSDYLSSARASIDACQKFHNALKAQTDVNVDPRLNEIAENLQRSLELMLDQLKQGLEKMSIAQQLYEESFRCQDPEKKQKILLMGDDALNEALSIQIAGRKVFQQIGNYYQDLERLRPILNKKYGLDLPQIKWMEQ